MSEKLFTPFEVDSDFDIRDSEGGLICLQGSCASDEVMIHIVHCVNNHERLVEALRDMLDDATDNGYESICTEKARTLLAALEAEKGGEL